MNRRKFACPLCRKPLTEHEYLSITGRWEHLRKLETDFRKKLHDEVQRAKKDERHRVSQEMVVLKGQLARARGKLREAQRRAEQGLTPQLEGLLYEKELAKQLGQRFRQDRIVPAGKGGDVIHHINLNGRKIGTIVYECKKVAKLAKAHVEQARRAKMQRDADFSVLVTSAKAGNTFGFWLEKDVLVIHPSGVLALVAWLRDSLIELAKARMPKTEREKAAREILDFLASPAFKNAVEDSIRRAEELGRELQDEVSSHRNTWLRRLGHYRAIWLDARTVVQRIAKITETHSLPRGGVRLLGPSVEENKPYPLEKRALFQTR